MAAGFSLAPEQARGVPRVSRRDVSRQPAAHWQQRASLEIDAVVSPARRDRRAGRARSRWPARSARAIPSRCSSLPDVRVAFADVVGKDHVRLRLAGGDGARLDAIAFRAADTPLGRALLAARGKPIHAAGRLRADDWNGRKRVQLQIEDAGAAGALRPVLRQQGCKAAVPAL